MAEYLATPNHIQIRIDDTINHAKEFVYFMVKDLAHLPQLTFHKLWEASSRGCKVFIIYNQNSIDDPGEFTKLDKFRHLSLYTNPSINFNTTFCEKEAVITSLSITGKTDALLTEFGVYIKKNYATDMFEKLFQEVKQLRDNGVKMAVHDGTLKPVTEIQAEYEAEIEKKRLENPVPAQTVTSKKLTAQEKQKFIEQLFKTQNPECEIKIEDKERIRVQGKGIVIFTNKERIEIIFVRYENFNNKKEDVKNQILSIHPGLPIWCTYNRITINADQSDEISNLYQTVRDSLMMLKLV